VASALTIAGSDPSGGAGIQADLKTFHQFGVYGQAAITLLTVQNTTTVERVEVLDPQLVLQQVRCAITDIPPQAAKTGALGSAAMVEAVGRLAAEFSFPLVVDPVMISKHGKPLMAEDAMDAVRDVLLPRAALVTPNLHEAAALSGMRVEDRDGMLRAAEAILRMGPHAVLVKGGHLEGSPVDVLFAGGVSFEFPTERIETRHTHGTGCTYSAAITACLALGLPLGLAVLRAKEFITEAIRTAPGLGSGSGPVNHFVKPNL
jgi:hydroxymethylpyrimidine/phosphomethylpyrimidine kinase